MIKVDVRNVPAGRRGQGAGDEDDDEQDEPRATRGNNQWGATGTLRCIPCRQRKCKCEYDRSNVNDKCRRCQISGGDCGEKLTAKEYRDLRKEEQLAQQAREIISQPGIYDFSGRSERDIQVMDLLVDIVKSILENEGLDVNGSLSGIAGEISARYPVVGQQGPPVPLVPSPQTSATRHVGQSPQVQTHPQQQLMYPQPQTSMLGHHLQMSPQSFQPEISVPMGRMASEPLSVGQSSLPPPNPPTFFSPTSQPLQTHQPGFQPYPADRRRGRGPRQQLMGLGRGGVSTDFMGQGLVGQGYGVPGGAPGGGIPSGTVQSSPPHAPGLQPQHSYGQWSGYPWSQMVSYPFSNSSDV